MKSFLGNFYRHLAIFSGHTGWDEGQRALVAQVKAIRVGVGLKTKVLFSKLYYQKSGLALSTQQRTITIRKDNNEQNVFLT